MNRHEMDFLEPGCPFVIVIKLTVEVIEKAIHAHAQNDAYWLKLHHFSQSIESAVFRKLLEELAKIREDEDKARDFD